VSIIQHYIALHR